MILQNSVGKIGASIQKARSEALGCSGLSAVNSSSIFAVGWCLEKDLIMVIEA